MRTRERQRLLFMPPTLVAGHNKLRRKGNLPVPASFIGSRPKGGSIFAGFAGRPSAPDPLGELIQRYESP